MLSKFRLGQVAVAGAALLGTIMYSPSGAGATALAGPPTAASSQDAATALATGLQALNSLAAASAAALAGGDASGARAAYAAFDSGWEEIEDGVRERSRDDYRSIEAAMREVATALRDPVDAAVASQWLTELQSRVNSFVGTLQSS